VSGFVINPFVFNAGGGGTSGGLPTTDLYSHHRADEITGLSDGNSVTSWPDESGNSRSWSAGNAPTYKTNIQNSLPIVRFNGTSNYMSMDNFTDSFGNDAHMLYFVIYGPDTSGDFFFNFGNSGTTNSIYAYGADGSNEARYFFRSDTGSSDLVASPADALFDSAWHIFTVELGGGTGSGVTAKSWIDGVASLNTTYPANAFTFNLAGLGCVLRTSAENFQQIDLAEMAIYTTTHGTSTREDIESTLATRWGITI